MIKDGLLRLDLLIYVPERIMLFDNILNHYRNKPIGYKTKIWLQWVSAFVMIGLLTLFYII